MSHTRMDSISRNGNEMTTLKTFDARDFRAALGRFATGVTVIATAHDGEIYGMTANAFMSVSLDPPLVLVAVGHHAAMYKRLLASQRYGVSVLSETQAALSDHFARRRVEHPTFEFIDKQGAPVLRDAAAHLVARIVDAHPAGDHTLFIGHVEFLEWTDAKPLLFFGGKYHRLKTESAKYEAQQKDFSRYLLED